MGIPKFFRWLSGRYPLVCERVSDDNIPEFDNLYLDMNGIIHNCTHPKDGEVAAPATDEERFLAIFYYIDFLFNKIRPQKVFFLGIDGVAPRAKMNEQRARRFRTAKELEELQAKELQERRIKGEVIPPGEDEYNDKVFDPTCITPGTEFMDKLTEALRYYINKRVSEDANWRKPQIILSAPNVPGEGEHKIMDYIRFSRAQPGYQANTRHCLYGLDADLIMLGLLSHEPHFSLLREEVLFGARARKGTTSADPSMQAFYLLHISILRDYLDHEFSGLKGELGSSQQYTTMEQGQLAGPQDGSGDSGNAFDLERIIDDYILMIMLVGNDFLPNLPKLSINGGALNFMFATYMRIRPSLGGYLHDNGVLNLERFEVFMREVAKVEVDSFKLEVADHQWYQVYKRKAVQRGETPEASSIVVDNGYGGARRHGRGGHRHKRHGLGMNTDRVSESEMFDLGPEVLGETTIPIKGNKLVISKSQQAMLELIRRFAVRALPKVAAAGEKVQMQFLPGPATALDNLIVTKAAEQLELHVGHEYAHDGAMTLYVAAGSERALAKLELEDSDSNDDDAVVLGGIGFVRAGASAATPYSVLGALEDTDDGSGSTGSEDGDRPAVPEFVKQVSDTDDQPAVVAYVDACLGEFDDAVVVADGELDDYTRKGDSSDFWQRFEMWKGGYYRAKVDASYNVPTVGANAGAAQEFRQAPAAVEPMCSHYIKTLQWVLQYYYHGCQSWSWYYPYHYAPCISDICAGLAAYKVDTFPHDEPYTPYEQLMCVLPPYSRKLLPAPLRALMVDVHSPIRDMFPTSFDVDMNGKKMPWEAVVLINFVDVDRIRAAMLPKLAQLSDDEMRRNSRGTNMTYSYAPLSSEADADAEADAEDAADVPSYTPPSNLRFPPIRPLRCKGMLYVLPTLVRKGGREPPLPLVRGLVAGAATRALLQAGFPSLFSAAHTARLTFNSTEVFGSPSRDESLVVELQPGPLAAAGTAAAIAKQLLCGSDAAQRVFVAWPYLRDAVVVGVSDVDGVYTADASGAHVAFAEHAGAGERQVWTKRLMDAVYHAKKMQAVIVGDEPRVLLHVLHLRGMQLLADGALVRDYGPTAAASASAGLAQWAALGVEPYHAALVVCDSTGAWARNPRFAERAAVALDSALPVRDRVFYLGRSRHLYGAPGKVTGYSRDAAGTAIGAHVQLIEPTDAAAEARANTAGVTALAHHARLGGERYRPSFVVARELGLPPLLLSRITSKMMLQHGDTRIPIGLDLKFEAKRLKVPGYTRRGPNGWLFSDRAVALVAKYKAAFPSMFARLAADRGNDMMAASLALGDGSGNGGGGGNGSGRNSAQVAAEVSRLKQWHKANVDSAALAPVPIESELLTGDQIAAILAAATTSAATRKIPLRNVRREALLRPADAQYLLCAQALMVGHRVVYVSDRSGSVPLGAKGYVVAIHAREAAANSPQQPQPVAGDQHMARMHQEGVPAEMIHMIEVVFDREFLDGSTLDDRCPPRRGALVPPHHVLDLTSQGLAQSTAPATAAAPRPVNVIRPAPDTVHSAQRATRANASAGQTAAVAAKARAMFARPTGVLPDGTTAVTVPEPRRAPWANGSAKDQEDHEHASRILAQLINGPKPAQPQHAPAAPLGDQARAQSIISTLLAGPMEAMSIGNSPKVHKPLVIEEEYFSDSMDEDEDEPSQAAPHVASRSEHAAPVQGYNQVGFDYSVINSRGRGGRGGRARGRGARGRGNARGRGRGGANANTNGASPHSNA